MQQLLPAVFYFVLLNRDLVCLTAGLWGGLGLARELEKCVFTSTLSKRRDLLFITGFIKRLKEMDGQIKPTS